VVEDLRRLKTPFALAIGVARVPVLVSPLSIWLRPWSDPVFLTDVAAFWTGSCMVREGEGSLLSDMEAQRGVQQSLRAGEALTDRVREGMGFIPFHNPPVFAVLLAPLTIFRVEWGYALWMLATVAAFLLSVAIPFGLDRDHPRILPLVALNALPAVAETCSGGKWWVC